MDNDIPSGVPGPIAGTESQPAMEVATEVVPEATTEPYPTRPEIKYEDFAQVELRSARILEAERVPKADKLLRLVVDLGRGVQRQILAGLAEYYEPENLIGKTIVVVANLAPRKMRGMESQGMLLAAADPDDGPPIALVTLDAAVEPGCLIR